MKPFLPIFLLVLIISACTPALTNVPSTPVEYQDFGYLLTWSPDDRLLSVTASTGFYVYDTTTFKQLAAFPGMAGSTVAFGDEYMAAINSKGLQVWELNTYDLLFQEQSNDPVRFQSVFISPDGKWLVTGEQKQFRLWELPGGNLVEKFPVDGFVSNLAFTDRNSLIVIEQYKASIQEWDLQNRNMIRSFENQRDVLSFTLSEDGTAMLVDYGEAGVELWNVETGEPAHYYLQMQGASGWTRFGGDHRVATVWGYAIDGDHSGMGVWIWRRIHASVNFQLPMSTAMAGAVGF